MTPELKMLADTMENAAVGFLVVKAMREGDEVVAAEIRHANKCLLGRAGYPDEGFIGVRYTDRFPGAVESAQAQLNALRTGTPWNGRIRYSDAFTCGFFDVQVLPWGVEHEYAISFSWNVSQEVATMQKALDAAQLVVDAMTTVYGGGAHVD